MAFLDTNVMNAFKLDLNVFTKALVSSQNEIEALLRKPGIQSDIITPELESIKSKLDELSRTWIEIANSAEKSLGISIEEADKLRTGIENVLNN